MVERREPDLAAIDAWFVRQGLPHFVEDRPSAATIWGRALPLLVPAYLLLGLNALKLAGDDKWSGGRNVAAAAFAILVAVATWVVTNMARHRRPFARPTEVGTVELAIFVLAPAVPSLVFGQFGDAIQTILYALAFVALLWFVASYGLWSLVKWAWRRSIAQVPLLISVVARGLPLLLLFSTFLFINAEVWQVAGTLFGPAYWLVLAVFFILGALFLLSRLPPMMRELNDFESWGDIDRLVVDTPAYGLLDAHALADPPGEDRPLPRQRFNIGLVTLFSQGIQITFVALLLTAFFVLFGVLAIPEATAASWTQLPDVHVFVTYELGGRQLVLSEPLLRVAGFLGAFTGMYFTVQLVTDASYREDFADDMAPLVRRALAVRRVGRALPATGRSGPT